MTRLLPHRRGCPSAPIAELSPRRGAAYVSVADEREAKLLKSFQSEVEPDETLQSSANNMVSLKLFHPLT